MYIYLKPLYDDICGVLDLLEEISFIHIYTEQNAHVDLLSKARLQLSIDTWKVWEVNTDIIKELDPGPYTRWLIYPWSLVSVVHIFCGSRSVSIFSHPWHIYIHAISTIMDDNLLCWCTNCCFFLGEKNIPFYSIESKELGTSSSQLLFILYVKSVITIDM